MRWFSLGTLHVPGHRMHGPHRLQVHAACLENFFHARHSTAATEVWLIWIEPIPLNVGVIVSWDSEFHMVIY